MPAASRELQDLHEQLQSFTFTARESWTSDALGNPVSHEPSLVGNGEDIGSGDEFSYDGEGLERIQRDKETKNVAQSPTRSWSDTGLYYYLPMGLGVLMGVAITALPSLLRARRR